MDLHGRFDMGFSLSGGRDWDLSNRSMESGGGGRLNRHVLPSSNKGTDLKLKSKKHDKEYKRIISNQCPVRSV